MLSIKKNMTYQNRDKTQNYWQLTCIQTASLGFPGVAISHQFVDHYGINAAFPSILLSGLILWLVGFAIISMAIEQRRNAIENAEVYIGRFGAILVSLISAIGFPIWYIFQTHNTSTSIYNVLHGPQGINSFILSVYGIILGFFVAILALGNSIQKIKKINTYFLPILLCYYLYVLYSSDEIYFPRKFELSLSCTISYISLFFPGMVNLPTFFRHARSKYDAYLSLTFITLIIVFFQIVNIWINPNLLTGTIFKIPSASSYLGQLLIKLTSIIFLVTALICSNLVNLYFSFPSWEMLICWMKDYFKLFFIGVISTIIYILIRVFPKFYQPMIDLNLTADDFIANLGVSLILIFLVRTIVMHRPNPMEKSISLLSWLVGSTMTLYAEIQNFRAPLISGIGATVLFFAVCFYFEEPFWSMKKLKEWIKNNS